MDILGIFNFIANQDLIFRFALIIVIALYGLFALILAIQVGNLNRVLHQIGASSILSLLAIGHALAAIALLMLAVVSL
jgi:hypothetical protein